MTHRNFFADQISVSFIISYKEEYQTFHERGKKKKKKKKKDLPVIVP